MKPLTLRRLLIAGALLVLLAPIPFLAMSLDRPAIAQDAKSATAAKVVRAAWAYRCVKAPSGKSICQVERTVPGASGKGVLMKVVIIKAEGVAKTHARFFVPLAVDLPSGVTYAVTKGGKKGAVKTAPYKTCLVKGCIAVFALDDALSSAMKAGKKLDVSFRMRDQKEVGVSVDLKGFSIVHGKLMGK